MRFALLTVVVIGVGSASCFIPPPPLGSGTEADSDSAEATASSTISESTASSFGSTSNDATSNGDATSSGSRGDTTVSNEESSTGSTDDTSTSTGSADDCMPPSQGICSSQPFVPFNDHVNGSTSPCHFAPGNFVADFNWADGAEETYYGAYLDLPCPDRLYEGDFTVISDTSEGQLVCGFTDQSGGDYGNPKGKRHTTLLQYTGVETTIPLALDPALLATGAYKLVCYSAVPRAATVTVSLEVQR